MQLKHNIREMGETIEFTTFGSSFHLNSSLSALLLTDQEHANDLTLLPPFPYHLNQIRDTFFLLGLCRLNEMIQEKCLT